MPSWRNDVAAPIALDQAETLDPGIATKAAEGCAEIEPECDLVEEVLRLRGLDAVPPVSLPRAVAGAARHADAAAGSLCTGPPHSGGAGPGRVRHLQLHGAAEAALFGDTPEALRLTNPIAADLDQLRPTPIATLALAAKRNAARGYPDLALFEIGPEFAVDADERPALDRCRSARRRDAAQLAGAGAADGCDGRKGRPVGRDGGDRRAAGRADASHRMLRAAYHPGRSATVRQGPKTVLGRFGELHPRVLAALDLAGPVVAFELDLDAVGEPKRRRKAAPDLPPFQPIRRDFAFLVDTTVTADAVLRAARGADRH